MHHGFVNHSDLNIPFNIAGYEITTVQLFTGLFKHLLFGGNSLIHSIILKMTFQRAMRCDADVRPTVETDAAQASELAVWLGSGSGSQ